MRPDDPRAAQLITLVRNIFESCGTPIERRDAMRRVVPTDLQCEAEFHLARFEAKATKDADVVWFPVASDDWLGGYRPMQPPLKVGPFAQVFRCKSLHGNQTAVVKFQPPLDAAHYPRRVSRALAESQALFGLLHPNIIRIFASGYLYGPYRERCPYIAMEEVRGTTLQKWLRKRLEALAQQPGWDHARNGLPEREAARVIAVVAEAIQACHDRGILHMDLSFNNVMVADSDAGLADSTTLKIIDFGAAAVNFVDPGFTTLAFVDPDRMDNDSPNARDDIFALGCLLYYLLAGETPKAEPNGVPIDLSALDRCDRILRLIVRNALARQGRANAGDTPSLSMETIHVCRDNPTDHYTTARQLAADLRDWADGYPVERFNEHYTWTHKAGLLLGRCREHDRVEDHSRL